MSAWNSQIFSMKSVFTSSLFQKINFLGLIVFYGAFLNAQEASKSSGVSSLNSGTSDIAKQWSVTSTATFSANTGSRVISATAQSKPGSIMVSKAGGYSGVLDMDTSTISMGSMRDRLLYEKVVQKAIKSVSIKQNDVALKDTAPSKDTGQPTQIPIILEVNEEVQNVSATVTAWKRNPENGSLTVQARFALSLKETALKIPSAIKINDQVDVEIELKISQKSK